MALRYGYFDSEITGVDSEGMPIFDRAENSELFALLFAKLVSNGVLAFPATCFQVLAGDSGLSVKVEPGFGMVNGRFAYNVSEETLILEKAPTSNSRIDWIVLRCNYKDRLCELVAKTGKAASSPTAPELLQPASGDYYELGLAQVRVSANQSIISQSAITDMRGNSAYCGYITQLIDHLETSVFYAQLDQFYLEFVDKSNDSMKEFRRMSQNAFDEWFDSIKGKLDGDIATQLAKEINATNTAVNRLNHVTELTLTAAGWEGGGPFVQMVSVPGAAADMEPLLVSALPDDADAAAQKTYTKAFGIISCGTATVGNGTVIFKAYKKPATDCKVGLKGV